MLKYQFSIFNLLYSFTKLLCCLRFFEKLCPPSPLATKNKKSVFIPEGFAHGFQTLEDDVIVNYCHSSRYSKPHERGVNVFDKRLNYKM